MLSDTQIQNFETNFTVSGYLCEAYSYRDFVRFCQSKTTGTWILFNYLQDYYNYDGDYVSYAINSSFINNENSNITGIVIQI
jgi:hypothetical protein